MRASLLGEKKKLVFSVSQVQSPHIHFHSSCGILRLALKFLVLNHFQEVIFVMKILKWCLFYVVDVMNVVFYRGADKSLARPDRKNN